MQTVLIVDDDPAHLKIYCWVVERGGFRCIPHLITAADANLPSTEEVDIVVLDYRLGVGLSAVEIAQQLRTRVPSTPILILSDMFGMPDDIAPFASGFVRKGEPQHLIDTLAALSETDKTAL